MKITLIFATLFTFIQIASSQFSLPEDLTKYYQYEKNQTVDFDLDGDIDLIGVEENLILLRNDGNGEFEKIMLTNSWQFMNPYIFIGDLNNDSYPDIVVRNNPNNDDEVSIYCYLNDGAGGLQSSQIINPSSEVVFYYAQLIDFDIDGDLDFVGRQGYSHTVLSILRNMGNMTFQEETDSLDFTFRGIFDIDADNDPDIFGSNNNGYLVSFNNGTGVFDQPEFVDFQPQGSSVPFYFKDVNMDGDVDLLSINIIDDELGIYKNEGNLVFTFTEAHPYDNAIPLVFEDINYDNYPDILYSKSTSYVSPHHHYLLNNGDGTFANSQSLGLNMISPYTAADNGYKAVADFDNNGFLDILIGNQKLFKSNGVFDFEPWQEIMHTDYELKLRLMDVNNDNIDDVVYTTNSGMRYQLGLANGYYSPDTIHIGAFGNYSSIIMDVTVTDFNQDGFDDIYYLIANNGTHVMKMFVNNGDGTFTASQIQPLPSYINQSVVADLSGDGFPDIFYYDINDAFIGWVENLGNLTFSAPVALFSGPFADCGINYMDAEGDGDNDIVYTQSYNGTQTVCYLPNDGYGSTFSAPILLSQGVAGSIECVTISDLNDDGEPDFLIGTSTIVQPTFNQIQIYYGNGLGNYTLSDQLTSYPLKSVGATDINNDGLIDLVVHESDYQLSILSQESLGEFSAPWCPINFLEINMDNFVFEEDRDLLFVNRTITPGIFRSVNNYYSNRVSGTMYVDMDNDGQNGAQDMPIPYHALDLLPSDQQIYTNTNGVFTASASDGTNLLTPMPLTNFELVTLPATYQFDAIPASDSVFQTSFGYVPNTQVENLDVQLIGGFPRCNTTVNYWIDISNLGTTIPSGIIELKLDSLIEFVSGSMVPDSVVGQSIYWHFDSLNYFVDVPLLLVNVEMPDFNSAGELLSSQLFAYVTDPGGAVLSVYTDSLFQIVRCAYDPNDKTAEPSGIGPEGFIPVGSDWLEYTIRFQNTGNDTAVNIVILDELDADLDVTTFTPLSFSFPPEVVINSEGLVSFSFQAIYLPDSNVNEPASHGFIRYRIRLKDNLAINTQITNTARIYFDVNPAIITNTALNTLFDCNLTTNYTVPTYSCEGTPLEGFVETEIQESTISWEIGMEEQTGDSFTWIPAESGTYDLSIVVSNNLCSSDTTVDIVIFDTPIIELGVLAADTICIQDGVFTLPSSNPVGGSWSGAGVSGNTFTPITEGVNSIIYTFTNQDNCFASDSITIFVENCLSIENQIDELFSIYPNPVTNSLNIVVDAETTGFDLALFNTLGESLFNKVLSGHKNYTIQVSELPKGVYMLRLVQLGSRESYMRKIIKE
ncbi:MAG: T9SS type A sorting domain-containing protein [Fluviicola sp.]|nr:T9SS type A sorting domain-containing protein [Fluviicola sp.]